MSTYSNHKTPSRNKIGRSATWLTALALAWIAFAAMPAAAQDCANEATIGNFEVTFEGTELVGVDTIFTYCITGLDVPGFRALSNWELSLDPACISADDVVSCEPGPCFHQVDDPNTGITGIKFDDLELEAGETQCFAFALAGDWTTMIGEVTAGLKAANDVSYGNLCGPVCESCSTVMQVFTRGKQLTLSSRIIHNAAISAKLAIWYSILDERGREVHRWRDRVFEFTPRTKYSYLGPIPNLPKLRPGNYKLMLELEAMNGWYQRTVDFVIE